MDGSSEMTDADRLTLLSLLSPSVCISISLISFPEDVRYCDGVVAGGRRIEEFEAPKDGKSWSSERDS